MTASGAFGKGTYRSVVAGIADKREFLPSYHACSSELMLLRQAHRAVLKSLYVRDKVMDSKFPENYALNGLFRLTPKRRYAWHFSNVMPNIRRRTIWMNRIQAQRRLNAELTEMAEKNGLPHPSSSLVTPDAAAYFSPQSFQGANNWPNYWQHESMKHVIPKVKWERHPELGGITRVSTSISRQANDF